MLPSLCGDSVGSRRALLAALWSLVTVLTALAFLTALSFTLSARNLYNDDNDDGYNNYYDDNNNNNNKDGEYDDEMDPEVAVTSRAMAFAALWTAVLASLITVFGAVVLGWQSPTGQYYTCCSSNVHRTTPLSLGTFIGALIMFANLTLVCSVLFGEFEIRDYQRDGDYQQDGEENQNNNNRNYSAKDRAVERSSMAFSIMCMFLTVMYTGFAALTFSFAHSILEELAAEERDEALNGHHHHNLHKMTPHHFGSTNINGYDGYIGERFDVHRSQNRGGPINHGHGAPGVVGGFVAPKPTDVATLT